MADLLLVPDDAPEEEDLTNNLILTVSTDPIVTAVKGEDGTYTLTREGGTYLTWEGQAYSNTGLFNGAVATSTFPDDPPNLTLDRVAFGMSQLPTVSDGYKEIGYGFIFGDYGAVCLNTIDPQTTFGQDFLLDDLLINSGDIFSIRYDGLLGQVDWLHNGVVIYTAEAARNETFFFDSSFKDDGAKLTGVDFQPVVFNNTKHDLCVKEGQLKITQTFAEALQQRLSIKFKLFKGEYLFDTNAGIDYYNDILVKGPSKEFLDNYFIQRILETEGVISVVSYNSTFNGSTRNYSVKFTVTAEDGSIVEASL